jgi:hypothetical protein
MKLLVKDVDEEGDGRDATIGIRLAQAVHHGTDHRSQISIALTALASSRRSSMSGSSEPRREAWSKSLPGPKVPIMRRFIRDSVARRRSRVENRRQAELRRAAREMQNRDANEDSIWRSGKGGGHHDRI